ncbi:MAG: flavin reductase [Chitinispirillales bacterium]|jgi:flavorubredoxin/flavin reductase (DIM6/NTAB) family NADH-FMN oxidoreductase RutF/rubredoxin|nr:flavin reductase [Chitinispirillales bacterium]
MRTGNLTKKITDDLIWVGANDRRLAMFEGVYSVPRGVSYNSYLLMDEKTVLFDTVDKAVRHKLTDNITYALDGRKLDYLIVQHMEPDHSAIIAELAEKYPELKIVCNAKTLSFIKQFYNFEIDSRAIIVKENDTLVTGRHTLRFIMAPMVHWPEVMVTYDSTDKILFSADAFGCFGALNGAMFADEIDFNRDYMDEARRYYANIAGKYGSQVQMLLKKAQALEIEMICPLHGFIWRKNIDRIIAKYNLWSSYEPEEHGVMIAYASVYGNTETAAEILAHRLRDRGVKTEMFDVSVTPASEIIAAAFKWSHLAFASTTYNAGIFITMEALINDLTAHNIQNRAVAIIENGSWAPTSGNLIAEKLSECKNINILGEKITLKSSLKECQLAEMDELANVAAASVKAAAGVVSNSDPMLKLPYGLFVLTAKDGDKDNGCIINTAAQITVSPVKLCVTVNKKNFTHDMILKTGEFNISVLSENAPFNVFERFGFHSGKDTNKFADAARDKRAANGIQYIHEHANAVICAKVTASHDYGTHSMFIADVTETFMLCGEPSMTYQHYFDNVKPKPKIPVSQKKCFVCKICGYVYEGNSLPEDYICPLCKHGAQDFEIITTTSKGGKA